MSDSIRSRLDEVQGVLEGLTSLEEDLRKAAGKALGKVGTEAYVGLSAQMQLLETLREPLRHRAKMLEEKLEPHETEPEQQPFPERVPEGEDPEHQPFNGGRVFR